MIKDVIKKIEITRDEDYNQEINPKQSVPALIPIEKLNGLLNAELKETDILLTKWKFN